MKTSEQIIVREGQGGPYRSLNLQHRKRRAQLEKEINRLKMVRVQRLHQRRDIDGPLFELCVVATGGLVFMFFPGFVGISIFLIGLLYLLLYFRFTLYLWFRWKQWGDPLPLIKHKLDELAKLPPE